MTGDPASLSAVSIPSCWTDPRDDSDAAESYITTTGDTVTWIKLANPLTPDSISVTLKPMPNRWHRFWQRVLLGWK
jgi:hypothetical protein